MLRSVLLLTLAFIVANTAYAQGKTEQTALDHARKHALAAGFESSDLRDLVVSDAHTDERRNITYV